MQESTSEAQKPNNASPVVELPPPQSEKQECSMLRMLQQVCSEQNEAVRELQEALDKVLSPLP